MNVSMEYASVAELPDQELVERYADLVRRIAYHLVGRLPASVDVNDLIQTGMLGLMEAARKYSGDRGANFETYAGIRIRGAMLDELRKTDWAPRSVHRRAREVVDAIRRAESRLGRRAEANEIAEEMGVELDEYFAIVKDAATCRMFSSDDLASAQGEPREVPSDAATPQADLEESELESEIASAIDALPEREQLVMSMYYDDELNLREIGEVLGVSESRVCQLHGQALSRIRARIERNAA
jgi:RNA polymerase sigma factor for flagellar operon FliA